jgi:hypothetical protein
MAEMITKMTDEQVKMMDVYRDKYIQLGFSTSKFTKEEATDIVNDLYVSVLNLAKPEKVLVYPSPKAVWDYIQKEIGQKIDFVWPYLSGSLDVNVFAFYDFCIEVLGVKIEDDLLKKYQCWKRTHILGLIFPFDDVCIISEKPEVYHRKGNVLHCDNGPAIRFADGFSVWILNGVRMKKDYVETPWDKLDVKVIMKETNAEVRRELVRKVGIERIVSELGATTLDSKDDYELLELDIGDNNRRPYLKMKNPSIGTYHIEGVPPGTKTVAEALIFRNGTDEKPIVLS